MRKEKISEFTRRVSQCNRSGLVVVVYDIFFAYLEEAEAACAAEDWESYKSALRGGERAVNELIGALDFSQDMAKDLYRIYVYCREGIATAIYKRQFNSAGEAVRLMRKLYVSFVEVAKSDHSQPLMQNAEQVFAGYTYGRNDVTETYQDINSQKRGFLA